MPVYSPLHDTLLLNRGRRFPRHYYRNLVSGQTYAGRGSMRSSAVRLTEMIARSTTTWRREYHLETASTDRGLQNHEAYVSPAAVGASRAGRCGDGACRPGLGISAG